MTPRETIVAIRKLLEETHCSRCDFDEAEGGLVDHCDACCRQIVTKAWRIVEAKA